ncbi:MAG: diguanylate cyclase [Thermoleophilia bacterium]|jgi:diguanylate cyclase (GGDEF)-like protein/PAS domain S-box-containing protein
MLVMLFSTISFLAAAVCLLFGTMVLLKNSHSRLNRVFMLLCISVAYWGFMEFELRHSATLEQAEFWFRLNFLWPLSIALLVHFVLVFTQQRWLTENRLTYLVLYGLTATISVLELISRRMTREPFQRYCGWTYDFPDSLLFRVSIAIIVAMALFAAIIALRFHLKQRDPTRRKQTGLVLVGIVIPIVLGSMADAILPVLGIRVPEMTATAFAVGAGGFIGFAIWKYELFGVTPAQAADNILAAISDSLFIVGPKGTVLTTNKAAIDLLGYQENELVGFPLGKIFGEERKSNSNGEAQGSTCAIEDVTDLETKLISRKKNYIPVSMSSSTLRDNFGRVVGKVIVARDMTQRKQAEKTILAQTAELEQYLKFFLGATDLMVTADPDGAFLKTNPACSETLGYSEAELLNKPFIEFVHPDDKQKTIDEMVRQQEIGDTLNFENRYVCKDGSIRWLSWRAIYNKNDGLTYATARDITESKHTAEELKLNKLRLDLAVDASQVGIWELDLIKDTSVRNLRHDQIFGYEEMMADWGAKKFFEHIITEDRPSVQTAFDVAMKQDRLFFECRILWPDKSIHWITATGKTVRDSAGKPQKMFGTVADITESKQSEAKILAQSEELKSINRELLTLNRITAEFSQTIDLTEVLQFALDTITDSGLFQIQHKGGIFIAEEEKLNLATYMGHDDKFLELHKNMTFDDCLCGRAARTGEIIISNHSSGDERHTIKYPGMQDHGHAIVPLKTADQVVGVLYLYLPAGAEIDISGRDLLQNIGRQLAISIENAKLYEETKKSSLHDPLTGLANRSLMKKELKKAFAGTQRTGRPVSVIMLDLDHFKKYNDAYGHVAGDRLLVDLANLISREIREIDVAVRYGGEEFIAILPDTSSELAVTVAERIRKRVESKEFLLFGIHQPTHITISQGIATYDDHITDVDMLVARADASLYRAKHNGRNRVEVWLPLPYQDPV